MNHGNQHDEEATVTAAAERPRRIRGVVGWALGSVFVLYLAFVAAAGLFAR